MKETVKYLDLKRDWSQYKMISLLPGTVQYENVMRQVASWSAVPMEGKGVQSQSSASPFDFPCIVTN